MIKTLVAQWPQLAICNGLLTRKWLSADNTADSVNNDIRWHQLIPPPQRRAALIQLCHTGMTGGHLGLTLGGTPF